MDNWVVKLWDPKSKVHEIRREIGWKRDGGEVVEGDGMGGAGDGVDIFVGGAGFIRCWGYEDDNGD